MGSKANGYGKLDLKAVSDKELAAKSGLEHAKELIAFAEAIVKHDPENIITTREALIAVAGQKAAIEACGTTAKFQRQTRLADCTGIPVDENFKAVTKAAVDALGMDKYETASLTSELTTSQRIKAIFMPILLNVIGTVMLFKLSRKGN